MLSIVKFVVVAVALTFCFRLAMRYVAAHGSSHAGKQIPTDAYAHYTIAGLVSVVFAAAITVIDII